MARIPVEEGLSVVGNFRHRVEAKINFSEFGEGL
jgi:hypothetical protein